MDITRFWFSDPKSRSANILSASDPWMIFDIDFCFYFAKITFLMFVDMHLVIFDVNSQ